MTCRPLASRARARARTSNAVSVPSRPIRRASGRMAASLDLALDAGAPLRAHHRSVRRARGEQHAIAGSQRQRPTVTEDEVDRAARAVEELVVAVAVLRVAVARTIRPAVDVTRLSAELAL